MSLQILAHVCPQQNCLGAPYKGIIAVIISIIAKLTVDSFPFLKNPLRL